jgi:hypothetical protein
VRRNYQSNHTGDNSRDQLTKGIFGSHFSGQCCIQAQLFEQVPEPFQIEHTRIPISQQRSLRP